NAGFLQIDSGGTTGTLGTGTVTLGGGTLRFNRSDSPTIANTITGAGSATNGAVIQGGGTGSTVILSGDNSYTGQTLVNNGILQATNSNALGATGAGNETIVNTNAAIVGGNGVRLQVANNITVGETLVLNSTTGSGGLRTCLETVSGNNTW